MSIKFRIGKELVDLPRGSNIPKEGDLVVLTLRGEKIEREYKIHSVEHVFDFNSLTPIGNTTINLVELKPLEE